MSDILDNSIRLKNKIDRMKENRSKAQGALEQIMHQIKTEHGCKTIEQAETVLKKIRRELQRSKSKIVEETERLEKELDEEES